MAAAVATSVSNPGLGKPRRRSAGPMENGDQKATSMAGCVDDLSLASAIGNGDDLGPIIRAAFEIGRPEALLHQLRGFVKKKEAEIEDLCKVHYEEFIRAVDELRGVLTDADALKNRLATDNGLMQEVGSAVLFKLDELLESYTVRKNVAEAVSSLSACVSAIELCAKANEQIAENSYYPALKTLDIVERDRLLQVPSGVLRVLLERRIPVSRAYIEKKVSAEFNDWLVQIRSMAREIGQRLLSQAATARDRDNELRKQWLDADEQSKSECAFMLKTEDLEDEEEDDSFRRLNLTPVYRAHHIQACLGFCEQFRDYYFENRKLQMNLDLQMSVSQSFIELHRTYFAQVAGFFVVEDRVLRTAGGLISSSQVENLWETAMSKVSSVLEEQYSRMPTSSQMLLVKESVSHLGWALKRYGYHIGPLFEVLGKNRERYHELLMQECRAKVDEALANDKYEKLFIMREADYRSNVLAFHLQVNDIMPAFPYVANFSASVPECCRIVQLFIDDSVGFLSIDGVDYHEDGRKFLEKLLITVLNEAFLKLIGSSGMNVSQSMQIAANMTMLERCCDFFALYAAQLCSVPARFAARFLSAPTARAAFRELQLAAHSQMLRLVNSKVDEFMQPTTVSISWTPDEPPSQTGNDYVNDVTIYLETLISTAQQILPLKAVNKVLSGVLKHISDSLVDAFLSEEVRKYNIYAVMSIDADLQILNTFANERFHTSGLNEIEGVTNPLECLIEARQLINLLLSNQPELYMNPVIRQKNYSALDYRKLIVIVDKYKDLPEKFFGGRSKNVSKKKSMDLLVKRLKDSY